MTDTINIHSREGLIDAAVTRYVGFLDKLGGYDAAKERLGPIISSDLYRLCLEQCVSKTKNQGRKPNKSYGFLRKPPAFHERPWGSLLLRMRNWHNGSGQLDGLFMATHDAGRLVHGAKIIMADDIEFEPNDYQLKRLGEETGEEGRERLTKEWQLIHDRYLAKTEVMLDGALAEVALLKDGTALVDAISAPYMLSRVAAGNDPSPATSAWHRAFHGS